MSEVHMLQPRAAEATEPDLLATIASRICHDLVSPLGAIANGVELLALSGAGGSPEMDLIAQSVEGANARIRFFRLAYGAAAPGQAVGRAEVEGTLRSLSRLGRLSFEWTVQGDQPRAEVKAVLLLLQCFETAMPMGGTVRVTRDGEAWEVVGEGPRLRFEDEAWATLRGHGGPFAQGAKLVQFSLLPMALGQIGRALALEAGPERIVARI